MNCVLKTYFILYRIDPWLDMIMIIYVKLKWGMNIIVFFESFGYPSW